MPNAAPRPCTAPGCGQLTNSGRCPTHTQQRDAARANSTQRGYGARWQRVRMVWLQANPFCVDPYGLHGPLVPGSQVDHITPHRGDERLMWDEMNWQTLCASCHSKKTATEDGGFGREWR